jgi:hypothetical protein
MPPEEPPEEPTIIIPCQNIEYFKTNTPEHTLLSLAESQRVQIFNSQFANEIKNKGTDLVLTQSPTIQRVSQRVILTLAMILQEKTISLYLWDIIQAHVQSSTHLNREFFPLYGVPEAGNHWFNIYHP